MIEKPLNLTAELKVIASEIGEAFVRYDWDGSLSKSDHLLLGNACRILDYLAAESRRPLSVVCLQLNGMLWEQWTGRWAASAERLEPTRPHIDFEEGSDCIRVMVGDASVYEHRR